jgi:hypothetical protein
MSKHDTLRKDFYLCSKKILYLYVANAFVIKKYIDYQQNMETNNTNLATQEFQQVHGIISLHRSRALQTVNNENLLTAWEVGAFVSARLKNSAWGNKTVTQLSEYLRTQDPTLRGYSRRNIYNMVAFYEAYSSAQFIEYQDRLKLNKFVQSETAQIQETVIMQSEIRRVL